MRAIQTLAALLLAAAPAHALAQTGARTGAQEPVLEPLVEPRVEPFRIVPASGHLAVVDLDGDGVREILRVRGNKVQLQRQGGDEAAITIPGSASIWTVADQDLDGRDEFLVMVAPRKVASRAIGPDAGAVR